MAGSNWRFQRLGNKDSILAVVVRQLGWLCLLPLATLLLASPALAQTELITNGSFSADSAGWTLSGNFHADHQFTNCQVCPGYAYLSNTDGSAGNNLLGTLYQAFTVPSGSTSASLTFWYKITTQETGSIGNDVLDVTLQTSSGGFLATVAVLSNLNQSSSYIQIPPFNLLPYVGQTVRLNFLGSTNGSAPTTFRVDTVSAVATLQQPPSAPSSLSVVGSGNNLLMGWTDNSTNESGFKVESRTGLSGSYAFLGQVGANVTAYQDSGRTFGNIYCYRVYAFNGAGASGYSNERCGTALASPTLTAPPDGQTISGNTATLQWNPVTQAEIYAVDMGSYCGDTTVLNGFATAGTSTIVPSLAAGTYFWRARAANSTYSGISAQSGCRSFVVPPSQSPKIRISPLSLTFTSTALGARLASAGSAPEPEHLPSMDWDLVSRLTAKAQQEGPIRVIVRIAAPFIPEGRLRDSREVEKQRSTIRATQEAVLAGLQASKVKVLATYRYIPFLALEVDAPALSTLVNLPSVLAIKEDFLMVPLLESSAPVIGAPTAWAAGYTGSGQVVAILDSGVDTTHPFFKKPGHSRIVSEACYSSGFCPNGAPESTVPGSGVNCPTTIPGCDHGTHVAGIAAGDDGIGPDIGIARGADIIAIQVFSQVTTGTGCSPGAPCAQAYWTDVAKGLVQVYALALSNNHSIAAVNMSLGNENTQYTSRAACDLADAGVLKTAIDNLRSAKIPTVISAGNQGSRTGIDYPGCISSAISVGETDDFDNVWDNIPEPSNIASFIDLLAPGVDINSSVPSPPPGGVDTKARKWGTSMSAAFVTGSWAILKQKSPTATVDEILAALRNTGTLVNDNRPGGTVTGMRRINVDKALGLGPPGAQIFTIFNDGNATLTITSMQLQNAGAWIQWSPQAPFNIAPGGSQQVTVTIDYSSAPAGTSTRRLQVYSNDSTNNPYPGGEDITVNRPTPPTCYVLSSVHTGFGSDPSASPTNSTGCSSGNYVAGASIQVTASPAAGWTVGAWSGTVNDGSTSTSNTVTMPASNQTVTVYYVQLPPTCYVLSSTHTGSGADPSASPSNSTGCLASQYTAAASIQVTASPAAGWSVAGWSGTLNNGSTSTSNTVTMPASNQTVTVNYVRLPPTCYLLASSHTGSGGDPSALPSSSTGCASGQYTASASIQMTASPAAGWSVGSWSGTMNDASTSTVNTVTMPASNQTVSVNYSQLPLPTATKYYSLAPCRIIDTRNPPGPLAGPSLQAGSLRTFAVTGACGVPVTATALSVNITVTGPASDGFFTLAPGGQSIPSTSNINFRAGQTRANNAILALAADGSGTFVVLNASAGAADIILDVSGYFQ